MSKELDELYKKLRTKQADLIHCRYKYIADKLEFEIRTLEFEIIKLRKEEGYDDTLKIEYVPF